MVYDLTNTIRAALCPGKVGERLPSLNPRQSNIVRHYNEQIAKGRMKIHLAAQRAIHDIEGKNA